MDENGTNVIHLPRSARAGEIPRLMREVGRLPEGAALVLDCRTVEDFDSSFLAFLNLVRKSRPDAVIARMSGELEQALAAFARRPVRPVDRGTRERPPRRGFLESTADYVVCQIKILARFFGLLADEIFHTFSYLRARRGVYPGEIGNQFFFMAFKSFPIICILIFLVGVTVSLMSAAQLKLFGADIYLADFVGLAMFRELVPLMTGVILAGKVGAAITAEISTMVVLEEVDALKTMGVVPEKFLMVPRLLAITMAVPLLVGLADFVGILGGILVARFDLGIPASVFLREMRGWVFLSDYVMGLIKTLVFGWAVVVGSGFKGLTVGRSAGEVGRATTESVVLSVTLIVLIDCLFAFIIYD